MARCRSVVVLGLLAMWLAIPALACLPNPQTTDAEMACCKKMAGDCHMGIGNHPCCKTLASAPQPVASIQPISQVQPTLAVVAYNVVVPIPPVAEAEAMQIGLGMPPPAPPGLNPILRI